MGAPRSRRWMQGRAAQIIAAAACGAAVLFVAVPEVALARARSLIDTRRDAAAARWLVVAEALSFRRSAVQYHAARLARRRGDFAEVHRRLRAAHALGWPVADLEREQWLALAQTGRVAEMQAHWQSLFADPRSDGPEISRTFVLAALQRIRIADARRVLEAWMSDHPADPEPYVLAGLTHSMQLEWNDAAIAYGRAVELDPANREGWRGLARASMKRLRHDAALEAWTALATLEPDDAEAVVGRGDCLARLGAIDAARAELGRVIERTPDDVAALDIAGRLALAEGDAGQATEWLERAAAARPEDAELRYALGRALRLAGRADEAAEHLAYREAATAPLDRLRDLLNQLPRTPWDADLRTEIGELTYRWKSRSEGVQWLLTALDVDPDHRRSRALLEAHRDGHPLPAAAGPAGGPQTPQPVRAAP